MSTFEILEFVKDINCNSNISIVHQIQLITSMTIASAKRSSSKLKLLKNYLKNLTEHIDVDTIINNFVSRDACRSCFV